MCKNITQRVKSTFSLYEKPTRPRHSTARLCEKICWTAHIAKMKVQKRGIKSPRDNITIPYGAVAATIVIKNPEAFPIEMTPKKRIEKVQKIIDVYFNSYTGVYDHMQLQIKTAKKRGYLRTPFVGRKRRLDMAWFESKWAKMCSHQKDAIGHIDNEARNFQIQSSASDFLTQVTRKMYDLIQGSNIPAFRILMTIHDQLLFNCHKDHVQEAEVLIRQGMETVLLSDAKHKYNMPLTVDILVEKFWGEKQYN